MRQTGKLSKMIAIWAATASFTMVACSKGSGDDVASTPLQVGAFGGCAGGCPQVPTPVANAQSSYAGVMTFAFQLFGDQQAVYAAQMSGTRYQGLVSVGGTLTVSQYQQIGYCALLPGQYTIQTIQGGMAQGSAINNLKFSVTGPGGSFLAAFSWANYLQSSQRIVGELYFLQGSGVGMGVGGQGMSCNDPYGFMMN